VFDDRSYMAFRYLAAIVESSDDAIVSKDLNSIIKSWNRSAERMFGFTADEAIGRSIRIIIPADRQAEEDEVLRRIRKGESVEHFETIRQRKDGTQFPVSLTISPIRELDGTIIGASKIARDISDTRRFQAALDEAEARRVDLNRRLAALVSASASLLSSPRIEEVLPAIVRIAGEVVAADGYAVWRLDPLQETWTIVSHVGISEEFARVSLPQRQGQSGAPPSTIEPIVAEDVEAVPALAHRIDSYRSEGIRSMLAMPLGSGEKASATLVFYYRRHHAFSDVEVETAQALANIAGAALRTADLYSEQRHREAQANFLAGMAAALAGSLDYQSTLQALARLAVPQIADWCAVDILSNGAIERLAIVHSDPEQVALGERFHSKYPPRLGDSSAISQVLQSGKPLIIERLTDEMIVAGAKDPEHLAALRGLGIRSVMMVPLRTREGAIGAITLVGAESGRRYSAADLRFAETIADRAAIAIENAWAYKEAQTANRLKDEFLATLSHELRTPLNAMVGYTRMLRTSVVPDERRDAALEVIERNGKLLAQIVDEVLDVSRIVSGKLRLNLQPVEPAQLVADAIAVVAPAAGAKGIEIASSVTGVPHTMTADPDRLQQVLWNLLTNAVKFTPAGGRIDVELSVLPGEVVISVADTGRGIDPAFLPHIFERFRQADSHFTRDQRGLGLGLSIARHIVEMHGGTIDAESAGEGRGATIRVRLPTGSQHQASRTDELGAFPV
jgi:PAS domain S-box-containing protein